MRLLPFLGVAALGLTPCAVRDAAVAALVLTPATAPGAAAVAAPGLTPTPAPPQQPTASAPTSAATSAPSATSAPTGGTSGSLDVSTLTIGAPATVTALDLGKLKGTVEELAWSTDGTEFYLQTVEKNGKVAHYLIAKEGGTLTNIGARPEWATEYWKFKSDRYAPGVETLVIDVKQSFEKEKYGTGSAGAADRTSSRMGADNINVSDNLNKAALSQTQNVVSLTLLGQTLGTWVNERPTPGTTFSWGPSGSGAIAFVDEKGQLALLDSHNHLKRIAATKDVALPAWSLDGSRLAYLYKASRNTYMLAWSTVTKP